MRFHTQAPDGISLVLGDCRKALSEVEPESFHVCVTSPPYYGLRRYAVEAEEGEEIGTEGSINDYVGSMVEVFAEVRRLLRSDGTAWLNIGDSFSGSGKMGGQGTKGIFAGNHSYREKKGRSPASGMASKQLLMVPFRLALALQDDGWWIRQTIIWEKPSPMPDSVLDRPTTAHEYIFMLAKSPYYYYDFYAMRVPASIEQTTHNRRYAKQYRQMGIEHGGGVPGNVNSVGIHSRPGMGGHNMGTVWRIPAEPQSDALCANCATYYRDATWARLKSKEVNGLPQRICATCGKTDWVSHFAPYPTEIPRRAIIGGTSELGVCAECGAPWKRVIERIKGKDGAPDEIRHVEWEPTCDHKTTIVPALVLDPFVGSGTSMIAARQLGRKGSGVDLSRQYLDLAAHRLSHQTLSMFNIAEDTTTDEPQPATIPMFE